MDWFRTGISKESLLVDVMYSANLVNRWTYAIQCVLFAIEEKDVPLLLIPVVAAVIAAAVGTVGGFFYSV